MVISPLVKMAKTGLEKFRIGLTLSFVFTSVLFVSIYFPLTYQNCMTTINRVPEYTEGHDCFCNNNVGATETMGRSIILASEWGKRMNGTGYANDIPYGDFFVFIAIYPVIQWNTRYYQFMFSKHINKIKFNSLEWFDPYDLINPKPSDNLCSIAKSSSYSIWNFSSNNSTECIDTIRSFFPNFEPEFEIDYTKNEVYERTCGGISYCEVQFCPTNNVVSIILFCCSIITTIYTLMRVINYSVSSVHAHYEKKKGNKEPLNNSVSVYQLA